MNGFIKTKVGLLPVIVQKRLSTAQDFVSRMLNAEIYSKHMKGTKEYEIRIDILRENAQLLQWREGERVLDAGCGPGDVTVHVLQHLLPSDLSFLLGVDISTSMITLAQKTYSGERIAFDILDIGGDISQLLENTFYSKGFDKIFSFFVLHWIDDLGKCIRNLYTLLRSGGQALLYFPVDRSFQKTYQILRSSDQWKNYFKDVKRKIPDFLSKDAKSEFEELALSAGFEVQKCEVGGLSTEYDSVDDLRGLAESLDPDINCVPAHLKNKYLNDCIKIIEDAKAVEIDSTRVIYKQSTLLCILRKP